MQIEEYKKMEQLEECNWWYRGRRFLVSLLFAKYFRRDPVIEPLFLDLGCGTGEGLNILKPYGKVFGLDSSAEAISIAKTKGYAKLHQGSAMQLPYADSFFDSVLMLDVLEHIPEDSLVLKECFRVLRKGGLLVMTVPAYQWLWSGHDQVFGHVRRYTKKDLVEKVFKADFKVVFGSYFVFFVFPVIAGFRLVAKAFSKNKRSHFFYTPFLINKGLYLIALLEAILLRVGFRFPFGGSVVLFAQKV